jgi:hypothetical protein
VLSSGNREVRRDGDKSDTSAAQRHQENAMGHASSHHPKHLRCRRSDLTYRSTPGWFGTNVASYEGRPAATSSGSAAAPTGPSSGINSSAYGPRAEQATERGQLPNLGSRYSVERKDTRSTESQPHSSGTDFGHAFGCAEWEANSIPLHRLTPFGQPCTIISALNAAPAPPQTVSRPISSSSSQPSGDPPTRILAELARWSSGICRYYKINWAENFAATAHHEYSHRPTCWKGGSPYGPRLKIDW